MKQSKKFIYMLLDPRDGKPKYIGKTGNLRGRYSGHLNSTETTKKTNWIKHLLTLDLKPIMEVLDEVSEVEVDFWERHYISLYKSWGFELKNMTIGGDGGKTGKAKDPELKKQRMAFSRTEEGKHLLEEKRKIKRQSGTSAMMTLEARRKAVLTRKKNYPQYTEEHRKNISKALKGKPKSEAVKEHLRKVLKGKAGRKKGFHDSEETRRRKSLSATGRKHSPETLEKIRKANIIKGLKARGRVGKTKGKPNLVSSKPVLCYDLAGNLLREFSTTTQASRELKVYFDGITNCCKGRIKQCKGYVFRYKNKEKI